MNRELLRTFVVVPGPAGAEERVRIGDAPEERAAPVDFFLEEGGGVLTHLRRAAGFPVRHIGRALLFTPLLLVAKLALAPVDRRASDLLVPLFATLVTLFFASLCLWIVVSFVWWLAAGRKGARAVVARRVDADLEAFEGVARGLSPDARVLAVIGELPDVHFAGLEVFAVVTDEGTPIIVAPRRLPRGTGDAERLAGTPELVPQEVAQMFASREDAPRAVVVRPGDRVRVRGARAGDVANVESFMVDGAPAALVSRAHEGAYRASASRPGILLGDGPDARIVVEKLAAAP